MIDLSWHALYKTDLQSVFALLLIPIGFLAYRLVADPCPRRAAVPEAARFVSLFTLVFAVETMVDPLATGPLLKSTSLGDGMGADLIPFLFVYLGDFRVLLLVAAVLHPERGLSSALKWAALATLIVPIGAGASYWIAGAIWPDVHGQVLWMLYEFGFFVLCIVLGRHWLPTQLPAEADQPMHTHPAARFVRSVLGYSAAYYALWLFADLVIVVGGLDLGWALRIVPNQLYYAFWIPFVYWRFFAPPRNPSRAGEGLVGAANAAR